MIVYVRGPLSGRGSPGGLSIVGGGGRGRGLWPVIHASLAPAQHRGPPHRDPKKKQIRVAAISQIGSS